MLAWRLQRWHSGQRAVSLMQQWLDWGKLRYANIGRRGACNLRGIDVDGDAGAFCTLACGQGPLPRFA